MRSFSKVAITILLFFVLLFWASVAIIEPFCNSQALFYMDRQYRESIAGSIDTLFLGASQVRCGIEPKQLDEACRINSYNISAGVLSYKARRILLQDEIERNPISRVFTEVSLDSLIHPSHTEGDIIAVTRMKNLPTRLSYLSDKFNVDAFYRTYTTLIYNSQVYYEDKISGEFQLPDFSDKGSALWPEPNDVTLYEDKVITEYNSKKAELDFNKDSIEELRKIADICKKNNAELILFVSPVSSARIWKYENLDEWREKVLEISSGLNCKLLDFNLEKNRYNIYSDGLYFYDENHLCANGAEAFGIELSRYINGELTENDFYSSYADMKNDSPYHINMNKEKE